jgi:hypothetical protein
MQAKRTKILLFLILVILVFIQVEASKVTNANNRKKNNHQRGLKSNKGTKRQEKSLNSILPEEPDFDYNSINAVDTIYNALNENLNSQRNVLYITSLLGQDVVLPCSVKNLGLYNTLWLRLKDGDVLAYDNMTVTQDNRFRLIKKTDTESNLMIKEAKLSDSGEYACQINTQSVKSRIVSLMVLSKNSSC